MIIGITGTDGAGKGAVVDYLVEQKGFIHYSARELILKEISKRGLPTDRKHMRLVANDLRAKEGSGFVAKLYLSKAATDQVENCVIESIRSLGEVAELKERGALLLAVDADQQLRFKRIMNRASESDKVSYEEFVKQEELEMNDPDPNGMQKAAVLEAADFTILNEGTIEELRQKIDDFLEKYKV